jgi:ubiquinone/menaquinone biosynthesis C-methylase UbiE
MILIKKGLKCCEMEYDPVKYKQGARDNWNLVAPDYHGDWASKEKGPFKSTRELVRAAEIEAGHSVLDVACGTGVVSAQVARQLGGTGFLAGIDLSRGMLGIAKSFVPEAQFFEMDAENISLQAKFDRIVCQYALMFFPDPVRVLRALTALTKPGGMIAAAVHGTSEGVPYFSAIMKPVLRHIPDIRPAGAPTVHRFGNPDDLAKVLASAGFTQVSVKEFVFEYRAGTFEQYWSDYLSTTAVSIRSRIEADSAKLSAIKAEAYEIAKQFEVGGAINFPWQVLIATAVQG